MCLHLSYPDGSPFSVQIPSPGIQTTFEDNVSVEEIDPSESRLLVTGRLGGHFRPTPVHSTYHIHWLQLETNAYKHLSQSNLALNSLPEYQSCLETKSKDWRNTDILYCRISMLIYQYHVFTFVLSRWLALCSANSITRYPDNIICLGTTLPISTQEWKECFSTFSVLAGFQWGKSLIYCHISCE